MQKLKMNQRFALAAILSFPMLVQMILMPLGFQLPGGTWTEFVLTTFVMVLTAWPFIQSAWLSFKKHHANMDTLVALGTTTAYLVSLVAMFFGQPVFFEGAALVITFILLGQVFEERMRHQAASAVEKLLDLQAKEALVIRAGHEVTIPLAEVVTGDLVKVLPGQKVPVDGKVVQGKSTVDESMVTGESMPVVKEAGETVIGATINTTGSFVFQAERVGEETLLAQIVDLVQRAQASRAPIQNLTDRVARIFVPAVLIVAILTLIIWYVFLGQTLSQAFLFALSILVIACPCALGLATPTALMVGTSLGAKHGVLIKNGEVLEAVNQVKTIVFDKTGTLTQGQPAVTDVLGDQARVLAVAQALEKNSEHPLASAIMAYQTKSEPIDLGELTDFMVIEGQGVRGQLNGQPVFVGNSRFLEGQTIDPKLYQKFLDLQKAAKTVVIVGLADEVIGLIALADLPKTSASPAVAELNRRGFQTVMLTGDHHRVGQAVADQVGIGEVIAEVLPQEKAAVVDRLEQQGPVAFVGDGINDAPALSTATVGLVMGSGTDIAMEAGDIILVNNDLRGVALAIKLSQKIFQRIKINLFWAFIYNLCGIPVAAGIFYGLGFVLSPAMAGLAMALSSLSVVLSSLLLNRARL